VEIKQITEGKRDFLPLLLHKVYLERRL